MRKRNANIEFCFRFLVLFFWTKFNVFFSSIFLSSTDMQHTTHSICWSVLGAFNRLCNSLKLSLAHHCFCAMSICRNDEILLKKKKWCRRGAIRFSTQFSFTWYFKNICCLDANRFLHNSFYFSFLFLFLSRLDGYARVDTVHNYNHNFLSTAVWLCVGRVCVMPDKSNRLSTLDSLISIKNLKMSIEVVSSGQYTKSKINRVKSIYQLPLWPAWSSILIYFSIRTVFKRCLKPESNSIKIGTTHSILITLTLVVPIKYKANEKKPKKKFRSAFAFLIVFWFTFTQKSIVTRWSRRAMTDVRVSVFRFSRMHQSV